MSLKVGDDKVLGHIHSADDFHRRQEQVNNENPNTEIRTEQNGLIKDGFPPDDFAAMFPEGLKDGAQLHSTYLTGIYNVGMLTKALGEALGPATPAPNVNEQFTLSSLGSTDNSAPNHNLEPNKTDFS